jgi:hypothetical protein
MPGMPTSSGNSSMAPWACGRTTTICRPATWRGGRTIETGWSGWLGKPAEAGTRAMPDQLTRSSTATDASARSPVLAPRRRGVHRRGATRPYHQAAPPSRPTEPPPLSRPAGAPSRLSLRRRPRAAAPSRSDTNGAYPRPDGDAGSAVHRAGQVLRGCRPRRPWPTSCPAPDRYGVTRARRSVGPAAARARPGRLRTQRDIGPPPHGRAATAPLPARAGCVHPAGTVMTPAGVVCPGTN